MPTQTNPIVAPATVLASLTELADTLDKYVVWETANGGSRLRMPLARAIRIVALSGGEELDPGRCPYCLGSLYEFQDADEHGVFSYFACEGERHTFRAIRDSGDSLPDFSEVEVDEQPDLFPILEAQMGPEVQFPADIDPDREAAMADRP